MNARAWWRLGLVTLGSILLAPATRGQFQPLMNSEPTGGPGRPLTIEVWSDVVCPFCYIGKRELERALAAFPHRDSVQVVWRSFELDPDAPPSTGQSTIAMLMERYGISEADARARVQGVVDRAAGLGLRYDMERTVVGSSFDAHRLLHYAKAQGRAEAVKERLFRAYFTEGGHLADRTLLQRITREEGLDGEVLGRGLAGDAWVEDVRADEREAQALGVRGVPFFVFDRRFAVSGAQAQDVFRQALEKAWDQRQQLR
ncbi:MAG: DsbA family oxidoreductase [Flavobacteriales bacterium]|nr:DsbA family oxidoreductase [Flavobacteriales bacterium]